MSYLKLNNFFLNWFENEPLINTISNFPQYEIDVNVETIYPLCNFYIKDLQPNQANTYSVLITMLDQVDIIPKVNNSKLIDATNHVDIVNELEHAMLRFTNSLRERNNDDLVFTADIGTIEIMKSMGRNGLSGLEVEITFEIPNEVVNY